MSRRARRGLAVLFTTGALLILDLLEEVVTFIINEDKGREIFHFDFSR